MRALALDCGQRETYIGPEEYCRLAVSHRQLERCDDGVRGLRGLRDTEAEMVYLVDEIVLLRRELPEPPCRPR
jgi:hypothetical protein